MKIRHKNNTTVPPTLLTTPQSQQSREVQDVEFKCQATGRQGPQITWYKNGEKLEASGYFRVIRMR